MFVFIFQFTLAAILCFLGWQIFMSTNDNPEDLLEDKVLPKQDDTDSCQKG